MNPVALEVPRPSRQQLADFLALTKPGILALLLVTEACAMAVAAHGVPPLGRAAAALLGLFLTAGGANAVNMWYDRDIDPVMERTRRRPIPAGRVRPEAALAFGLALGAAGALELALTVGALAAGLALAGYVYYVVLYTMWLKRRTPQNIVIGGGAGAFPPLVGWAAITGHVGVPAVLMFLIVFLWTPPHFWALALYRDEDYRRAGVPMLPSVAGPRAAKVQSLVYALLLVVASALLYATGAVGLGYLIVALALGLAYVTLLLRLLGERPPAFRLARLAFRYSLLYLAVLFAAMVLDLRP
jgi:protoheme IX farnesyltransferase